MNIYECLCNQTELGRKSSIEKEKNRKEQIKLEHAELENFISKELIKTIPVEKLYELRHSGIYVYIEFLRDSDYFTDGLSIYIAKDLPNNSHYRWGSESLVLNSIVLSEETELLARFPVLATMLCENRYEAFQKYFSTFLPKIPKENRQLTAICASYHLIAQ